MCVTLASQECLNKVLLFNNLDRGSQRKVVREMYERPIAAGEILIQEGDTGAHAETRHAEVCCAAPCMHSASLASRGTFGMLCNPTTVVVPCCSEGCITPARREDACSSWLLLGTTTAHVPLQAWAPASCTW